MAQPGNKLRGPIELLPSEEEEKKKKLLEGKIELIPTPGIELPAAPVEEKPILEPALAPATEEEKEGWEELERQQAREAEQLLGLKPISETWEGEPLLPQRLGEGERPRADPSDPPPIYIPEGEDVTEEWKDAQAEVDLKREEEAKILERADAASRRVERELKAQKKADRREAAAYYGPNSFSMPLSRAEEWYEEVRGRDASERERKHWEKQKRFAPMFRRIVLAEKDWRDKVLQQAKVIPMSSPKDRLSAAYEANSKERATLDRRVKDFEERAGIKFYNFGKSLERVKLEGLEKLAASRLKEVADRASGKPIVEDLEEETLFKKFLKSEYARRLWGPEPDWAGGMGLTGGEYKPAGDKLTRMGLVPALFDPFIDIPGLTKEDVEEVFGDSKVAQLGAGLINVVNDLTESLASVGGILTLGGGPIIAKGSPGLSRTVHGIFAADLSRNVIVHNPEVLKIWNDPDSSLQEKTEAVLGQLLLTAFAGGALRGAIGKRFKAEKVKTPDRAVSIFREVLGREKSAQKKEAEIGPKPIDRRPAEREPLQKLPDESWPEFYARVGEQQLVMEHLKGEPVGGYGERGVPVSESVAKDAIIRPDPEIPKEPELAEPAPLVETTIPKDSPLPLDQPIPKDPALPKDVEIPRDPTLPKDVEIPKDRPITEMTVPEAAKSLTLPEFVEWHKAQGFVSISRELLWRSHQKDPLPHSEAAAESIKAEADLVKAVEEGKSDKAKVEETVKEVKAKKEEIEDKKIDVMEPPPEPPVEVAQAEIDLNGPMHKLVKRSIKRLREEGNREMADLLEADSKSYYDILPSTEIAKAVELLKMPDVNEALTQLDKGGFTRIEMLLRTQKENLLYEEWKAGKTTEKVYRDFLQENADKATLYGQLIEQMKHLRNGNPVVIADKIEAILKKENLPPMSKTQRADLEALIAKSKESRKLSEIADEAFQKNNSEENFKKAVDLFNKAEMDAGKQFDFLSDLSPKLWSDIYVSHIQGNFLTPTTLAVNLIGNVVPLPLRATSRLMAKGVDLMDEFMFRPTRMSELEARQKEFREMDKTDPRATELAAEIAKLKRSVGEESTIQLEPGRGLWEKWAKGFTYKGIGLKRLKEGLWDSPWGEKRKGLKKSAYDDAVSSLLWGQRASMYEARGDRMPISPLNHIRAFGKLHEQFQKPSVSRSYMDTFKLMVESTTGIAPTWMFRFLAAGDLPFKIGEFNRLVSIEAKARNKIAKEAFMSGKIKEGEFKSRLWDRTKIARAQERPELFFNKKELKALIDARDKATFQNETLITEALSRANIFLKRGSKRFPSTKFLGDTPLYAMWRTLTPYQKTLANILGENAAYTPLGYADYIIRGKTHGWESKEAKLSLGRAMTGTSVYLFVKYMMDKEVIAADLDAFMSEDKESKKVRYMTEEVFPHGYINLTALTRMKEGEDPRFKKGDHVMDLRRIGPIGFIMLANASFVHQMEGLPEEDRKAIEESWAKTFGKGVSSQVGYLKNFMLNQSFATGARNAFRAATDSNLESGFTQIGMPFAKALPTSVFPNTLDWFYKRGSEFRRDFKADTATEALQNTWNQKMAAMGFTELDDPYIIDLWGTNVETVPKTVKGKLNRFLYSTFNVGRGRQQIPDPESSEVYRLWRDSRDNAIVPPLPSRYLTKDGKLYKLNKDQYVLYSRLVGGYRLNGAPKIRQTTGERVETVRYGVSDWINDFGGRKVDASTANGLPQGMTWRGRPDFEGPNSKAAVLKRLYRSAQTGAKEDFFGYIEDWERLRDSDESFKKAEEGLSMRYKNLAELEEIKPPSGRSQKDRDRFKRLMKLSE